MQARLSRVPQGGPQAELRSAATPSWTSSAACRQFEYPPAAGVITIWKRHLRGSHAKLTTLCSAPGMPLPALPADQFAARPPEIQRKPARRPRTRGPPPIHPLVARSCSPVRPRTWTRSSSGMRHLFAQLETRWKEHAAKSNRHRAGACRSPNGSRCGRPFSRPAGRCRSIDGRDADVFSIKSSRPARSVERRDPASRIDAPGVAAAGDGDQRRAEAGRPARLLRGNPGPTGPGGAAAVPHGARRRAIAPPFQKGSGRLEMARAIADPRAIL